MSSKSSKSSDAQSTTRLIPLGRLVNTHGVRGELRLLPHAYPCPTLRTGIRVFVQGKTEPPACYSVERVRLHAPFVLVRFHGISSLAQAQALRESVVLVEEHLLPPLQEGEFYHYQVVGLPVFTTAGEQVGTIAQVFFSGEHDVWVVRQGKKEYLLPVTEDVVRTIDIQGGRVIIEPMPGLLD